MKIEGRLFRKKKRISGEGWGTRKGEYDKNILYTCMNFI
jgi:hypothetical protein